MKRKLFTLVFLVACTMVVQGQEWTGVSGKKNKKDKKVEQSDENIILRNAISINTGSMEFAPVLYQNGIVYVTSREKFGPRDQNTGETYYELYYAELGPEGMPIRPQSFSVELNSPMHESSVAFNHKGDRIYLTRNNMTNGLTRADAKGTIRMKIYEADRGFFDWENVRELPFNSDEYSCLHPTLSPDGSKLFFSSDKPDGGYGGFDLWFVIKDKDGWSDPINLGPKVNTTGNDVFPFMHGSNTLFFSSDGYRGKGGLDIYMIDLSGNRWGEVINLGEPFNSPADDLSLILAPDGKRGFFASNREGGFGKDDIYAFEAPEGIQGVKAPERRPTILAVRDAVSGRNLPEGEVRVFELASDGYVNDETLYDVQLLPSTADADSMVLKYQLKSESELGAPAAFTNRLGEVTLDLEAGQLYLMLISKRGYQTRQFSFSPDKNLNNDPVEVLLEQSQCIDLSGILVSTTNGQPVPNASVRIVNETTGEVSLVQSKINGKFEFCLSSGCNYVINAAKPGFRPASTRVTTERLRGSRSLSVELSLAPDSETVLSEPIREGTVIVLEDLYYDFNKSFIRTQEARSLEGLVKLMEQYPSMEIELGAHTDSRGSADYNLQLSLRRSESAKDYLVQRGIAAHRIRTFGYGESRPRNHCQDGVTCTEEEYQYNRRTEVKITRIKEPVAIEFRDRGPGVLGNN